MSRVLQAALAAHEEFFESNESPLCLSKAEWAAWKHHEEEAKTLPVRRFICRDCSIPYQREMVKQNKCFMRQWDSEIEGFKLIDISKIVDD
mgnify:CR=1 FL=1